jgi:DNA processing protein
VLGCGIDIVYPPENAELFDRLAKGGGAVVSEFAPGTPSVRPNFPRRNRTISGLSSAVVVVRAAQSSGALITADHAAKQGRLIFAVPGDATQPLSAGPNELLKLGVARAVTSAADLLRALGWPAPLLKGSARPVPAPRAPEASPEPAPGIDQTDHQVIDDVGLKVWRALDTRTPLHVDELAGRLGLPSQEVLRGLADLELKGMCLQRPGKYFLRKEP